jgi:hypothetical protein
MANRPQTLYALTDSPVGPAAWVLDHDAWSEELISRVFKGESERLTRDDILDNVTLSWLTNTQFARLVCIRNASLPFLLPRACGFPLPSA